MLKGRTFDLNSGAKRFHTLLFTIAGCVALAFYVGFIRGEEIVYTHFFYIPVILAGMWYHKKAVYAALFLSIVHILVTHLSANVLTLDNFAICVILIAVAYIIGVISEKHAKGEEEIKREKNFSENIVATIPDSLLVLDKDLRVKSANRMFYETFQKEPEKVIGSRMTDILGDEDGKLSTELTKLVGTKDMLDNFEMHYQPEKLGERIFNIRARGIIIAEEEEEEEEELIVLRDITHRKQMEVSLRKSHDELKNTNEQLKQEIEEHERAEEAKRKAEQELEKQRLISMRADRLLSLGEMAAGIAHELNQPLSGVRGLSEHLLIGMDRGWDLSKEKTREKLKLIMKQADRMTNIIEHVRMFAREAGKPEVRSVNVNDVVSSAMDMVGTQFKTHGLNLNCELADGLPLVSANPFSLEEVVLNLMTNARDATEERLKEDPDSPSEILLRTLMDRGVRKRPVKIQVIDQGAGIPPEELPKIFDPFFTTKDPDKGTGLGMSICKSIVEQFGGKIDVGSTTGQGTTVTVSLPAEAPK